MGLFDIFRKKPNEIRVRCQESNADVVLKDDIEFRDSRGNFYTFAELRRNYKKGGSSNKPILFKPLNLPKRLREEHKKLVIEELQRAKCYNVRDSLIPFCSCRGENGVRHQIHLQLAEIICLTGDVSSGKTAYFTMLNHFFEKQYIAKYGIPVDLEPATAINLFEKLEDEIINGVPLAPNEKTLDEINFQIRKGLHNEWPEEPISLVSYDSAGEIIHNLDLIKKHFKFLKFSGSIVLFVDPYSIEELANQCVTKDKVIRKSKGDPFKALRRLVSYLKQEKFSQYDDEKMDLALVFTKCDQYISRFDKHLRDLLNSVHHPGNSKPDLTNLSLISDSFRTWLLDLETEFSDSDNDQINRLVQYAESSFRHVGYFPISAFGEQVRYKTYDALPQPAVAAGPVAVFAEGAALDNTSEVIYEEERGGEDERVDNQDNDPPRLDEDDFGNLDDLDITGLEEGAGDGEVAAAQEVAGHPSGNEAPEINVAEPVIEPFVPPVMDQHVAPMHGDFVLDGKPDPLFLDYPILWLYQMKDKK